MEGFGAALIFRGRGGGELGWRPLPGHPLFLVWESGHPYGPPKPRPIFSPPERVSNLSSVQLN